MGKFSLFQTSPQNQPSLDAFEFLIINNQWLEHPSLFWNVTITRGWRGRELFLDNRAVGDFAFAVIEQPFGYFWKIEMRTAESR